MKAKKGVSARIRHRRRRGATHGKAFEELGVTTLQHVDLGVVNVGVRADILEPVLVAQVLSAVGVGEEGSIGV